MMARNQSGHAVEVSHVGFDCNGVQALDGQPLRRSFMPLDVRNHDARTFHGQSFCRSKADAVSGTGDDRASACQMSHVNPPGVQIP
jgi:hypothetical protein